MKQSKRTVLFLRSVCFFISVLFCLLLFSCNREQGRSYEVSETKKVYILNINSKKIHKMTCGTAEMILEKNRKEYEGELQILIENGYTTCGNCFR